MDKINMRHKITYYYTEYPHSKRATDASRAAGLLARVAFGIGVFCLFVVVIGVFVEWDTEFTESAIWLAACTLYEIIYFKILVPRIRKMAEDDLPKVHTMTEEERRKATIDRLNETMRSRYK